MLLPTLRVPPAWRACGQPILLEAHSASRAPRWTSRQLAARQHESATCPPAYSQQLTTSRTHYLGLVLAAHDAETLDQLAFRDLPGVHT
jgi:hypothetical protein